MNYFALFIDFRSSATQKNLYLNGKKRRVVIINPVTES